MNLADKPCYPVEIVEIQDTIDGQFKYPIKYSGLTFREALVIALAGNPDLTSYANYVDIKENKKMEVIAKTIALQADAIIKELEKK